MSGMQDAVNALPSAGQGLLNGARTRDAAVQNQVCFREVCFGGRGALQELLPYPRSAAVAWRAVYNASESARKAELASTRFTTAVLRVDACLAQEVMLQATSQPASQDEWDDVRQRSEQTINEANQHLEEAKLLAAEVQRLSTDASQFALQCRESAAVGCSSSQQAVSLADAEAARAAEDAATSASQLETAVKKTPDIKVWGEAIESAYACFRDQQTQAALTLAQQSAQTTGAVAGQPGSAAGDGDKVDLRRALLNTTQAQSTSGCLQAIFAWLSRMVRICTHRNGETKASKRTALDAGAVHDGKQHDE